MSDSREIRIRVAGILMENDRLLLVAHKKNDSVYWLLPGGGVEFGESLKEALKREFMEELNIEVTVEELAMVFDSIDPEGSRHIVNICFNCSWPGGDIKLGDDTRLHDFKFERIENLAAIQMIPPVGRKIAECISGELKEIYSGKIWVNR